MSYTTKQMFMDLGTAAAFTLVLCLVLLAGCSKGVAGALVAIGVGVPALVLALLRFSKWQQRFSFTAGCWYTGQLYAHADGRIDGEIMPDGTQTRANAILIQENAPPWLVLATETNGIANVRRVRALSRQEPLPRVKHTELKPFMLY